MSGQIALPGVTGLQDSTPLSDLVLAVIDATIVSRFWSKVAVAGEDDCWNWQRGLDKDGYGKFQIPNPTGFPKQFHVRAHRLSYALAFGHFPTMMTLHQCDNAQCVNPRHLRDGTQRENIADKVSRGRVARGDRHGSRTMPHRFPRGELHRNSKLNDCDIEQILRWSQDGVSGAECARRFGVHTSTVCKIIRCGGRQKKP